MTVAEKIDNSLDWAHPLVRQWFFSTLGSPTEPQRQGWPHILAGETTLISAPTGSGKTFAAFLACLDALVRKAIAGTLCAKTEVLYISPVRIGLSATQKPLTTVANFLTGNHQRPPAIINIGHARHLLLSVEVSELGAVASNEAWDEIYDRIAALAEENRSTLIFANTRRTAERAAHHLAERLGKDKVAAHHGSLSRKLRLTAETKLKNGELKALVATASLELGIDIGTVDLVCQLGSPRSIAVMLQRVGRAGHWHGATSKGCIFATTRDELVESAALVHAILEGDLDQLIIPKEPLDVLAQQIVASCATDDWLEKDLFSLVKKAFHYKDLSRETFNTVIEMLADGIAGSRGRYGAYLFRDRVSGVIKGRRGSRLTAITSGGAIPENGLFTLIAEPTGVMVGTLDEDFAVESNRGDIILLGSTSWKIRRIESSTGRVIVEDAHGASPSVPFWRGEAPGRTIELSLRISTLRQHISDMLPVDCSLVLPVKDQATTQAALHWLTDNCKVNAAGAEQIVEYILQGRAVLGAVPTQTTVIVERFFDEAGGMQLIIHAPFGARINKAWGLALRKCFCRAFNFELQASATDNGINIALTEQHSFPLSDVFQFLNPKTIQAVLTQAVLQSPLFATRWRWNAGRSLALVRFRNGKKVPPNILRMLADDLLAAVFPDAAACQDNLGERDIELPDHPLINEAMKDSLTEALDLDGLITVLTKIRNNEIHCIAVDTVQPSQFAHEILNANPYAFLDDAPLEERRARAVELRRVLPQAMLQEIGRLDLLAIEEIQLQAWPDVRNADELQDALQTFIAFPADQVRIDNANWHPYFEELLAAGRAGSAVLGDKTFWFSVEKAKTFAAIYPHAVFQHSLSEIENLPLPFEAAILQMLRGWMLHVGPITKEEISTILNLNFSVVEQAFLKLEATGFQLRGNFKTLDQEEWCERRLLARIHRLTLGRLRKEIEPVTAAQFVRWLLTWQHLAPGTQLKGEQGLLEIIGQLQGFEIPAKAWEKQILAKRVSDYDPAILDRLCLMGIIGWGRLSSLTATCEDNTTPLIETKRVIPTSIAPITFFVRETSGWMSPVQRFASEEDLVGLSHIAKSIYVYLQKNGASFFHDIAHTVGYLKSEVEKGLWELVTAGVTTADGFDNLRSLIDPRRRLGRRGRHRTRHQYSTGRWSLLKPAISSDHSAQMEATCWLLLKRYGVVFRDLLTREKIIPRWRDLLIAFRRLEDKGEVRGGRFVDGFLGEQFALPYAVDSLRAIKKKLPTEEIIALSAVDPLNVVGSILPGTRIMAVSGKTVLLQDGVQILKS